MDSFSPKPTIERPDSVSGGSVHRNTLPFAAYHHVQAFIVSIDQYAEVALGNRKFFLKFNWWRDPAAAKRSVLMWPTVVVGQDRLRPCSIELHKSFWDNCQGAIALDNGNFVGEFKGGKANGPGTYTYSYTNGNKYIGEFKDDMRSGQALLPISPYKWPMGRNGSGHQPHRQTGLILGREGVPECQCWKI